MKRQSRKHRPAGAGLGFTLIEIMLALGVLGVGMVMVAAIFPAAIYQTRASDRTTHAILICQNAETILKLKATDDALDSMGGGLNVDDEFVPVVIDDPDRTWDPIRRSNIVIHADDAWYPTGPYLPGVNDRQGWVALVRRTDAALHEYQMVVVAYRKFEGMGYDVEHGNSIFDVDEPPTDWGAGQAYCDGRERPALVRISNRPWPSLGGGALPDIQDVTITQDDDGCFVWVAADPNGVGPNADALRFISIGSPVILDGRAPSLVADWGRFPTIVEIEEDPVEDPANNNELSYKCRLSSDIFAEDDDTSGPPPWPRRRRGIWVMPGAGFRTPSPAIGASSFRTVLR